MVQTRTDHQNRCSISKIFRKNLKSQFCRECLINCRKTKNTNYFGLVEVNSTPRSSRIAGRKKCGRPPVFKKRMGTRCCNDGCKRFIEDSKCAVRVTSTYTCLGCYVICQKKNGLDDKNFDKKLAEFSKDFEKKVSVKPGRPKKNRVGRKNPKSRAKTKTTPPSPPARQVPEIFKIEEKAESLEVPAKFTAPAVSKIEKCFTINCGNLSRKFVIPGIDETVCSSCYKKYLDQEYKRVMEAEKSDIAEKSSSADSDAGKEDDIDPNFFRDNYNILPQDLESLPAETFGSNWEELCKATPGLRKIAQVEHDTEGIICLTEQTFSKNEKKQQKEPMEVDDVGEKDERTAKDGDSASQRTHTSKTENDGDVFIDPNFFRDNYNILPQDLETLPAETFGSNWEELCKATPGLKRTTPVEHDPEGVIFLTKLAVSEDAKKQRKESVEVGDAGEKDEPTAKDRDSASKRPHTSKAENDGDVFIDPNFFLDNYNILPKDLESLPAETFGSNWEELCKATPGLKRVAPAEHDPEGVIFLTKLAVSKDAKKQQKESVDIKDSGEKNVPSGKDDDSSSKRTPVSKAENYGDVFIDPNFFLDNYNILPKDLESLPAETFGSNWEELCKATPGLKRAVPVELDSEAIICLTELAADKNDEKQRNESVEVDDADEKDGLAAKDGDSDSQRPHTSKAENDGDVFIDPNFFLDNYNILPKDLESLPAETFGSNWEELCKATPGLKRAARVLEDSDRIICLTELAADEDDKKQQEDAMHVEDADEEIRQREKDDDNASQRPHTSKAETDVDVFIDPNFFLDNYNILPKDLESLPAETFGSNWEELCKATPGLKRAVIAEHDREGVICLGEPVKKLQRGPAGANVISNGINQITKDQGRTSSKIDSVGGVISERNKPEDILEVVLIEPVDCRLSKNAVKEVGEPDQSKKSIIALAQLVNTIPETSSSIISKKTSSNFSTDLTVFLNNFIKDNPVYMDTVNQMFLNSATVSEPIYQFGVQPMFNPYPTAVQPMQFNPFCAYQHPPVFNNLFPNHAYALEIGSHPEPNNFVSPIFPNNMMNQTVISRGPPKSYCEFQVCSRSSCNKIGKIVDMPQHPITGNLICRKCYTDIHEYLYDGGPIDETYSSTFQDPSSARPPEGFQLCSRSSCRKVGRSLDMPINPITGKHICRNCWWQLRKKPTPRDNKMCTRCKKEIGLVYNGGTPREKLCIGCYVSSIPELVDLSKEDSGEELPAETNKKPYEICEEPNEVSDNICKKPNEEPNEIFKELNEEPDESIFYDMPVLSPIQNSNYVYD